MNILEQALEAKRLKQELDDTAERAQAAKESSRRTLFFDEFDARIRDIRPVLEKFLVDANGLGFEAQIKETRPLHVIGLSLEPDRQRYPFSVGGPYELTITPDPQAGSVRITSYAETGFAETIVSRQLTVEYINVLLRKFSDGIAEHLTR